VYIAAHPDFTQVFVVRDEKGEVVAGSKVKKIEEETRSRLRLDVGDYAGKQGALLEYTVVQKDLQNKGLLQELTKTRVEWAKEKNIEFVCAEVEITRPVSAWTKIRDGFVMVGLNDPGEGIPEPYFVAVKPLTEQKKEVTKKPEWKEIVVSEETKEELKGLFSDGWVGVDVKFDNEEGPMTLILEK
jgi:predicted GNAT family acetyltransferase